MPQQLCNKACHHPLLLRLRLLLLLLLLFIFFFLQASGLLHARVIGLHPWLCEIDCLLCFVGQWTAIHMSRWSSRLAL